MGEGVAPPAAPPLFTAISTSSSHSHSQDCGLDRIQVYKQTPLWGPPTVDKGDKGWALGCQAGMYRLYISIYNVQTDRIPPPP